MDSLDARILLAIDDNPDASVLALAGKLGIARNTFAARLQRMEREGAIKEFSRRLDPAYLGKRLVAFVSVSLSQPNMPRPPGELHDIPEVVEMHATSGDADLLVKVVAEDTADLHRITGRILAAPGVVRTNTVISLCEELPPRMRALVEVLAEA
ncbi:Lrp/AsnC family transcriptional regulator [Streptomyces sp. NBC_00102]|uniref:Lrp/AsnC family transcriptional regulator n=1 Tax=Streptomyces sp. NBC_00102 TaxID=2975652 RepID=UPI002252A4D9|nr:Lrp/AsnC family transcriptional regulator [Streptomyces sp. NBC_00102]MCX5400487.1 Lrp/AsnC family transcriptional regulator [Streptomyces sp. NBC_00102]